MLLFRAVLFLLTSIGLAQEECASPSHDVGNVLLQTHQSSSLTVLENVLLEDDVVSAKEWRQFQLLNELRAQGFTCPGGAVFATNSVPLKFDCRLWRASRVHSDDMATQNYYSHYSKDGRSPWQRASEQGTSANGENVIARYENASAALRRLRRSSWHCRNLLQPSFKSMAVGHAFNAKSRYRHYWTQMFSRSSSVDDTSCYPDAPSDGEQSTAAQTTMQPDNAPIQTSASTTTIQTEASTTQPPTSGTTAMPPQTDASTTQLGNNGDEETASTQAWEHFQLVNALRAQGFTCPGGRSFAPNPVPLKFDCRLWVASKLHSEDMGAQGYFSHTSKDGRSPWQRAKAAGTDAHGENIAAGRSTAAATLEAFKRSDGHCRNMMKADFKVLGVGYAYDAQSPYRHYWTQMYSLFDSVTPSCYPSSAEVTAPMTTAPATTVPQTTAPATTVPQTTAPPETSVVTTAPAQTTAAPQTDASTAQPQSSEATTAPTTTPTTMAPQTEASTATPTTAQTTTAPQTEASTAAPTATQTTMAPQTEASTTQPKTPETTMPSETEASTTQPKTWETTRAPAASAQAWEHFKLVNELRAQGFTCPGGQSFAANPVPLKFDCRLWVASRLHSEDMGAQGYFSHTSLDGRSPWQRANAAGTDAHGENIAAGRSTAAATLEAFKNSDGHCRNMMKADFKVMGVGYAYAAQSRYRHYWTQMYSLFDSVDDSCYPSDATAPPSGDDEDGDGEDVTVPETTAPPATSTTRSTVPPQGDQSEVVSARAWEHFGLLNDLRSQGFTCPRGDRFAANPVPLKFDCGLWVASKLHSEDMASNGYFSHTSQDGRSPWKRAEEAGTTASSENIAAGNGGAAAVLEQWKKSDGHCNNMMSADAKVMGVGHAYDADSPYIHYWTQMFSRDQAIDTSCYPPNALMQLARGSPSDTTVTVNGSVLAEPLFRPPALLQLALDSSPSGTDETTDGWVLAEPAIRPRGSFLQVGRNGSTSPTSDNDDVIEKDGCILAAPLFRPPA